MQFLYKIPGYILLLFGGFCLSWGGFIIIIFFPALKIVISYFFSPSDETEVLIRTYLNVRIFSIPAELIIYVLVGFYLGIQTVSYTHLTLPTT